MEDATDSPLAANAPGQPDIRAIALVGAVAAGHFDELRGCVAANAGQTNKDATNSIVDAAQWTGAWTQLFENIAGNGALDLKQHATSLARQIRDNGLTYNVYPDEGGSQRPWSLDLFPLLIEPDSWQQIETGVTQRMRLLERVMADAYGPQQLLARGLLPPALVQGHPGYLRAMHGVKPVGGTHLHIAAFDLARGPNGNWWLLSQRCQAPSGLGYLLENRLAISGQFPQAFQAMRVQRLADTYRALMDSLKQMSPAGPDAHLALLTPGPYNETYFEHAYLARYLGLTLVEGRDLLVRDERLYFKTLKGLVPVDGLLKRVDDEYLDPLELRPDSTLGVPGLLQAIRAGNVLVANAPGSAFLESPALLGFLPALSRYLLGEELQLPALPTWWCGERSAMEEALPRLRDSVIKPTYPGSPSHGSFDSVLGRSLSPHERDEWAGRIVRQSEEHTVQAYVPLSQMPTWQASAQGASTNNTNGPSGQVVPRSVVLRVFAVSDGPQSWRVLPGGLARVAGAGAEIASMQRGGSSADVWALTRGEVDTTTLLQPHLTPASLAQRKRLVTSRAAENLFWLGRYTERAENAVRLARLTLECLNGEDQSSLPLLAWLSKMAVANTLVLPGVPAATQARRVFERSLISSLGSTDGWRLLSIGRHIERLGFLASSLACGFETGSVHTDGGFDAMVSLFDSTLTFHAQYQQSRDLAALIDLLVQGRDTPRSLAWVAHTLRGRLAKLAGSEPAELSALSRRVPDPTAWSLAQLCEALPDRAAQGAVPATEPGYFLALNDLLLQCTAAAFDVSDAISSTYFTHSIESKQSVGT